MQDEIIKKGSEIILKADNYLKHLKNLLPKKFDPILIPYRKKDKWGFCTPDKEIVIDCMYDFAYPFKESKATVWNELDKNIYEEVTIDFQNKPLSKKIIENFDFRDFEWLFYYDYFKEEKINCNKNLERVQIVGKYGFKNNDNKIIVPCIYDDAICFKNDGGAIKLKDKWALINNEGKMITNNIYVNINNYYSNYLLVEGNDWRIIDNENNLINDFKEFQIPYSASIDKISEFRNGIAFVQWDFCGDRHLDCIDIKGNIIEQGLHFDYDYYSHFYEGHSVVGVGNPIYNRAVRWGFIDMNFKEFFFNNDRVSFPHPIDLMPYYGGSLGGYPSSLGVYSEGLAQIRVNDKWGYINKEFKYQIKPKYERGSIFVKGLGIALVELNGKYGYINKEGVQYWED